MLSYPPGYFWDFLASGEKIPLPFLIGHSAINQFPVLFFERSVSTIFRYLMMERVQVGHSPHG
jgi:hypothetical protein